MTAALPFNTGGRCAPGWAAGGRSADVRFAGYRTPHLFATAARGDGPGVLILPPVLSYSAILPVDWLTVRAGVALAGAAAGASAAPSLRSVRDLRGSKRVLSETPLCDRQDPL